MWYIPMYGHMPIHIHGIMYGNMNGLTAGGVVAFSCPWAAARLVVAAAAAAVGAVAVSAAAAAKSAVSGNAGAQVEEELCGRMRKAMP